LLILPVGHDVSRRSVGLLAIGSGSVKCQPYFYGIRINSHFRRQFYFILLNQYSFWPENGRLGPPGQQCTTLIVGCWKAFIRLFLHDNRILVAMITHTASLYMLRMCNRGFSPHIWCLYGPHIF